MVELLDELIEASDNLKNSPYTHLIHLLGTYIAAWDDQHYQIEPAEARESLAALMQEHQLTQKALSEATGISQGEISRLLRGERKFSTEHAKALAHYFRVGLEVFA